MYKGAPLIGPYSTHGCWLDDAFGLVRKRCGVCGKATSRAARMGLIAGICAAASPRECLRLSRSSYHPPKASILPGCVLLIRNQQSPTCIMRVFLISSWALDNRRTDTLVTDVANRDASRIVRTPYLRHCLTRKMNYRPVNLPPNTLLQQLIIRGYGFPACCIYGDVRRP